MFEGGPATLVATGLLALLAVAHTVLGERVVLRPLFDDGSWRIPGGSRTGWQRLLRFVWHATTIAWIGLGAVAVGAPPAVVLAVVAAGSGLWLLVRLPGHLAWPVLLAVAVAAGLAAGLVPAVALRVVAIVASVVALGGAVVHVVWATGRWTTSRDAALPATADGRPLVVPGRAITLAVAAALLGLAAVVVVVALGVGPVGPARWAAGAAAAVLGVRAVGDGRQVGFSKTDRSTTFAVRDDALYTPLVVLLSFGAVAALLA